MILVRSLEFLFIHIYISEEELVIDAFELILKIMFVEISIKMTIFRYKILGTKSARNYKAQV